MAAYFAGDGIDFSGDPWHVARVIGKVARRRLTDVLQVACPDEVTVYGRVTETLCDSLFGCEPSAKKNRDKLSIDELLLLQHAEIITAERIAHRKLRGSSACVAVAVQVGQQILQYRYS